MEDLNFSALTGKNSKSSVDQSEDLLISYVATDWHTDVAAVDQYEDLLVYYVAAIV